MSNIEWSSAPEWATKHGIVGTYREYPIWFSDTQYTYCDEQQEGKVFNFSVDFVYKPKEIYAITERPAPQWSGEGLPPIGVPVEWSEWQDGKYQVVTVLAYAGGDAWIQPNGRPSMIVGNPAGFRPIRTPSQIAAEEREAFAEKLVSEMGKSPTGCPNAMNQARKIFDLGYRKGDAK